MSSMLEAYPGVTGVAHPLFKLARVSDGFVWNKDTAAYEAEVDANVASYGITGAESDNGYRYLASNPSPDTTGKFYFYEAAGATLALTDVATYEGDVRGMLTVNVDEEAIAAAILAGLSGVRVTIVSPLSKTGRELELVVGDAYTVANGQPIVFNLVGIQDLAGSSVRLGIGREGETALIQKDGVVVTHGTGPQTVRFELSKAQTQSLDPDDKYKFNVQVEWPGTGSNDPYSPVIGDCFAQRKWT